MSRFVSTVALVVVVLFASSALAQNAMVSGTILDPSNAVLPGVDVSATRSDATERNITTVVTDAHGRFAIHDLVPGAYTLTATLPGFETFRASVTLGAGETVERDVMLQVGSLQETITVSINAAPLPPSVRSPRAYTPPPPPRPAAPGVVRVGGNIKPPAKTYDVHPVYPAALAGKGEEGHVDLLATIGGDGSVHDIKIVSSPNPEFANAATNAVSQWQFTPTLLNGSPIDVHMRVAVNFTK